MKNCTSLNKRTKVLGMLIAACWLNVVAPAATADTLFDDLGGKEGVVAVVDQFLWNLADNKKVSHYFVETNIERFRDKLIEYICQAAQGPCTYSGDSMERTHKHMGVTITDFNVTVESLILAMESRHIPTGVQNRLLKALAVDYSKVVQE